MDTDALMQFHAAELLESHAQLDRLGIPREDEDGEKLTISQRVKLAMDFTSSLVQAQTLIQRMRT
jgi:hypothetical protein